MCDCGSETETKDHNDYLQYVKLYTSINNLRVFLK